MLTPLLASLFLWSDLNATQSPLDDYFVQSHHGSAQNKEYLAVLNFSQMKTKLCIINLKTETLYEIDDPRLKIFLARKVFPYKDGFLVVKSKYAFHVSTQLEFKGTIELDSFSGRPPNMLWYGTQLLSNGRLLCRFLDDDGFHILALLDLETKEFLPLHKFHTKKHHTVNFHANGDAFFALHSKTGAVVEHDAAFGVVRSLLPENEPVERKKTSRLYRRNPFISLVHGIHSDATTVWFDVYRQGSGTNDLTRKRFRIQDGKLHAVSGNSITLARFEGKTLLFDTEEGMFTVAGNTP